MGFINTVLNLGIKYKHGSLFQQQHISYKHQHYGIESQLKYELSV